MHGNNGLTRLSAKMLWEGDFSEMTCMLAFQVRLLSILSTRDLLSFLVYLDTIYINVYCCVFWFLH